MDQCKTVSIDERIVAAMIQLARVGPSQRIIVAGSGSAEMFLELHRRGYWRVTTTQTCRAPCGQFDVALFASREHSIKSLEATLDRLVHFVSAAGALVVWLDLQDDLSSRRLRLALERVGFRIEAGTRCENGIVISARRRDSAPIANVG